MYKESTVYLRSFVALLYQPVLPLCRKYLIHIALFVFCFCQFLQAQLDSSDQKFLEGLRGRRLYELAVTYCQRRLQRSAMDSVETAIWTAQLVRTYAEQALFEITEESSAAAWQNARQIAARYLVQDGNKLESVWVRHQAALVELAWGSRLRETLETTRNATQEQRNEVVAALRKTAQQLEEFEHWLDRMIPTAPRAPTGKGPGQDDLMASRSQVRLLRGIVLRNQALCYPPGEDRFGLLAESLQALEQALSQLAAHDPLTFHARLEQAISQRYLGNAAEAEQLLLQAAADTAPEEVKRIAAAERLRLLLSQGRSQEAFGFVQQAPLQSSSDPEWDLALLEMWIYFWQHDVRLADGGIADWRARAVESTRRIEKQYGPYWGRRAEKLLLEAARSGSGSADAELVRRQADDLFLRGNVAAALELYDQAAELAGQLGARHERWLALGRAARLAEQLDDPGGAARRWRTAALDDVARSEAPVAHREALRQAARAVARGSLNLKELDLWLEEHLQHWPQGELADEVRLILAARYHGQHRTEEALALCQAVVSPGKLADAVRLARSVWESKLQELPNGQQPQALAQLRTYFGRLPAASDPNATALATVTRLWLELELAPNQAARVAAELQQLDPSQMAEQDRADYLATLFLAYALQPGQEAMAERMLAVPTLLSAEVAADLAARLTSRLAHVSEHQRRALCQITLKLLDRCAPGSEAPVDLRWVQMRVESLLGAEQPGAAVDLVRPLAEQHPTDAAWQLLYARVLGRAAPTVGWQSALEQWRRIAAAAPLRSDLWYEAKLGVAEALAGIGQKTEAQKLLRYLLLTAPFPEESPWKRRYEELLNRLHR